LCHFLDFSVPPQWFGAPVMVRRSGNCAPLVLPRYAPVYENIPSSLFPELWAVSLMRQYRNRFYSNADHTRRIRKGRYEIRRMLPKTAQDACRVHTTLVSISRGVRPVSPPLRTPIFMPWPGWESDSISWIETWYVLLLSRCIRPLFARMKVPTFAYALSSFFTTLP